jgi:hypothetical protein
VTERQRQAITDVAAALAAVGALGVQFSIRGQRLSAYSTSDFIDEARRRTLADPTARFSSRDLFRAVDKEVIVLTNTSIDLYG